MISCPPDSSAEAKLLETVQAKATALVQGLRGFNRRKGGKNLVLWSSRRGEKEGDVIEVYKILKGLTRIDPAEFWEVREAMNGAC